MTHNHNFVNAGWHEVAKVEHEARTDRVLVRLCTVGSCSAFEEATIGEDIYFGVRDLDVVLDRMSTKGQSEVVA